MPRFIRGYERQDFSELLNELHNPSDETGYIKLKRSAVKVEQVSMAQRRRSSLMDNPKMLYVYSSKKRILHDRECLLVKDIPDEHFCMSTELIKNMKICPSCYRSALIRKGIGDDRRHVHACERFFNQAKVSNKDLYLLLVRNEAKIRWINNDVIQIRIKDDTWRVIRGARGLELWHNNYICLEDLTRHFTEGFHKQTVYGMPSFQVLLKVMLNYSWEGHVAKFGLTKENVADVVELNNRNMNIEEPPLIRDSIFMRFVKRLKRLFKFYF